MVNGAVRKARINVSKFCIELSKALTKIRFILNQMSDGLIEKCKGGYKVKTSQTTPGTKIHCAEDQLSFEKVDNDSVKITVHKNARISKGP